MHPFRTFPEIFSPKPSQVRSHRRSFRWLKVRSILWPPHYKVMGEKPNPSLMPQSQLFYPESSYARLFFMIQVQIMVGDLHTGHLGSYDVIRGHQQVLANNSRLWGLPPNPHSKEPMVLFVESRCLGARHHRKILNFMKERWVVAGRLTQNLLQQYGGRN